MFTNKHLKTISCVLQFHDSVLSSLLRMPIILFASFASASNSVF